MEESSRRKFHLKERVQNMRWMMVEISKWLVSQWKNKEERTMRSFKVFRTRGRDIQEEEE